MPHLTNATGFRLIRSRKWASTWFADQRHYKEYIVEDFKVREFLENRLRNAGFEKAEIERSANDVRVTIHVSRPGLVIGRGGAGIESLKKDLQNRISGRLKNFNVVEIKKAEMSAKLVAENIANQIMRRYPHRRAVEQAIERTMAAGAKGIKIGLGGRLNGAEQARTEKKTAGEVPLSTVSSEIDYAATVAQTKYGTIGIKVWIHK